jgi:hypothetical protein
MDKRKQKITKRTNKRYKNDNMISIVSKRINIKDDI